MILMRIELNSGGLGGSAVISGFQTDFSSLISKSRRVVSSFQVVKTFSNHMNGGIGSLQNAVDQIDSRMQQEEAKADALKTAQKKSEDFLELVHTIDEKVSILVNRNKHDFYDKNPWAKPPQEDNVKKYCDKIKDYVCKNIEKLKEGLKNIAKTVIKLNKDFIDTVSKAWDNVKNWYEENKDFIKQVAIEIAIGAAVIGLAALTGGASLAITVAIGAGVSAALGAGGGALEYYMENGTMKGASKKIIGDAAKGFMTGAISGYVGGEVAIAGKTMNLGKGLTTVAGSFAGGVSSAGGEAIHAYADGDGITEEEKENIIKSGINGLISGGIGAYKGYGKDSTLSKLMSNEQYTKNTADAIRKNAISNMKQGMPNSIYNAQEAIKDLSSFNKYLTKGIIKDGIWSKFKDGLKNKVENKVRENISDNQYLKNSYFKYISSNVSH